MDALGEALSLISESDQFPSIPRALIKHLRNLAENKVDCRILRALTANPQRVAKAIDTMFAKAIAATGLSADELLSGTDFNWRERDPARIEAAFAEIRAVNFLREQGFHNIVLLPSRRQRKADIQAERRGQLYAVEVADSAFVAQNRVQPQEISGWILAQLQGGKIAQLRLTAAGIGATKQAFIAIIDTEGAVPWNTHDEFMAAVRDAWVALGSPSNLHVCAVTGRQALGYPPDDAIVPPWPS